jgi:hypothetical protein
MGIVLQEDIDPAIIEFLSKGFQKVLIHFILVL